jgi:hypothetical protein
MFKKILAVAVLTLGVASAASYNLKLIQPSVVKGTELKPGEYRMKVENDQVKITNGKQTVETSVKVETGTEKYSSTTLRYEQSTLSEIRLGGTKTKLVFSN